MGFSRPAGIHADADDNHSADCLAIALGQLEEPEQQILPGKQASCESNEIEKRTRSEPIWLSRFRRRMAKTRSFF
jgi:hypothetical protein